MKCLSCGDTDCAVNKDGFCRDCAAEIRRQREEAEAEYQENNPPCISGNSYED